MSQSPTDCGPRNEAWLREVCKCGHRRALHLHGRMHCLGAIYHPPNREANCLCEKFSPQPTTEK